MRIVFMGSADFGIPALRKLMEFHTIAGIVSTPAKPQGRGLKLADSAIAEFAKNNSLGPILLPSDLKSTEFTETLAQLGADLFVVVAFRILPRAIFIIPRLGTINIHASLLPKYRGPAPIHRAIQAGERETGVTIFRIDEGIDTGEILSQSKIEIGPKETTPELYSRLSELGANALIDTLCSVESSTVHPLFQNSQLATKAPKLSKQEALIDWSRSSKEIFNTVRAFKPFPGTFTLVDSKRLNIEWGEPLEECVADLPGVIGRVGQEYIDVQCGEGVFRILEVKPEGKRCMKVKDFLQGTKLSEGKRLG